MPRIERENSNPSAPNLLEGSLNYMNGIFRMHKAISVCTAEQLAISKNRPGDKNLVPAKINVTPEYR